MEWLTSGICRAMLKNPLISQKWYKLYISLMKRKNQYTNTIATNIHVTLLILEKHLPHGQMTSGIVTFWSGFVILLWPGGSFSLKSNKDIYYKIKYKSEV